MTLAKIYADNRKKYALRAFLYGCFLASLIVVPVMIQNDGYFLYYGDFNVQQIPFYKLAHDSIISGNIKWSHLTDLGANFVGSYSFYLLFSPFFLITLLLKSSAVSYAIGPLLMLKLGCASLTAYIYLKRYVYDKRFAVIGGITYAFCGFSVYNIFFFHFHEAIILLPLLLWAIDEFMYCKRKGVVALLVFLTSAINYYFFFGQAVFAFIYWLVKIITGAYRFKFKSFFNLIFECVLGVMMGCVALIPSIAAIIGNERVSEILTGYDALVYPVSQRYAHILSSFFFPPDIPARANFAPDSNSNWSSVALWLPLFSTTFVFSYLKNHKKSWLKIIIITLFVFAFVPILNSAFQAFNSCYYARWFYIFSLMMILSTVKELENIKTRDLKTPFIYTLFFTLIIGLSIGLMPKVKYETEDFKIYSMGLYDDPVRFWVYFGISVLCLLLIFIIIKTFKNNKTRFIRAVSITLSVVCVLYSVMIIQFGKNEADQSDEFTINYALNYGEDVKLFDKKDVRSDFYSAMDNIGMYWQVPNIQAFHSIVPSSLMDFYNTVGVNRDVASRPETKYYGLRGFLSVKYLFDDLFDGDSFITENGKPLMPAFKSIGKQNGFDAYENTCYIPMGFMYDKFICEEEFKDMSNDVKHLALLKAMVLSQEDMKKYSDITGYKAGQYVSLNAQHSRDKLQNNAYPKYDNFDSITKDFQYNYDAYYKDCKDRKNRSCESFVYTNDGFEAQVDNKGDDNLLFFSVPYDEGFTAFVNDEPAEIVKVNIGFMAVKVDGHKRSSIRFEYNTPGLRLGLYISIAATLVFIIYLIINKGFKAKSKGKKRFRIKSNSIDNTEV